jgi:transaldolase
MNALSELSRFGQSCWIDDLTRTMIDNGELQQQVDAGVTGVTDNPAIFKEALEASDHYDPQIARLAGRPVDEIYEALIITDVRAACDILRPVYERTAGRDGFVSLEVSPLLAHDAQGSIEEARRFWQAAARPNLFIKIPGTVEGVTAIESLLAEGINVNITLLFSIERYEAVALAYRRALERRRSARQPLDTLASVASFFLSRIDTAVDKLLQQKIDAGDKTVRPLLGKAAIANAKLAYERFKEMLSSAEWQTLQAAGARPQKLLWASTSTKNPAYDELMYVEPLIGPQTINTLPRKTLALFADHGKVRATVEQGVDEARKTLHDLAAAGIDLSQVTDRLLDEGIQKFTDAFQEIRKTIAHKTRTPAARAH